MNTGRRVLPYMLIWAALLFAFVSASAVRFWRDIKKGRVPPNEPLASVDKPLEKELGVRGAAGLLQDHLAPLPPQAHILFLSPKTDDDTWDFLYSVVSYLSWPRTLQKKALRPNEPATLDTGDVDVLICCGIPVPPEFTPRWSLGPNFVWTERR